MGQPYTNVFGRQQLAFTFGTQLGVNLLSNRGKNERATSKIELAVARAKFSSGFAAS